MSMRILLYSSTSRVRLGGVQAVYARLAKGLRQRGHTVFEAWSRPSPPRSPSLGCAVVDHRGNGESPTTAAEKADDACRTATEYILPLTVPKLRWGLPVPRSIPPALHAVRRLCSELHRCRPDVVHVHFVRDEALYFLALRRVFGYKVVLTAHGSDVLRPSPRRSKYLPLVLSRADSVTAVTRAVAARVRSFPGVDSEHIHLVPNGVDVDFWAAPTPSSSHSGPTCPTNGTEARRQAPTIVAVGRLTPVKGFDVLLKAFATVCDQHPTARLILIGDGKQRDSLIELAKDLRVRDHVEFTGHISAVEVREKMRSANVFALPSRSEGMPLALLEAMSAGTVPVAARVGGVPDVVVPGTGLLVPPEDSQALAGALMHVLQREDDQLALSRAARRRAKSFLASETISGYENVYLHTQ